MRGGWALALAGVMAALPAGCGPTPQGQNLPPPAAQVDHVHLRLPLDALRSLDGSSTPQAVLVEVLFERADEPVGVPVKGMLEVRMYEGTARAADLAGRKPFHSETYPNSALQEAEGVGMFGVSYRLVVPWGPQTPAFKSIWIEAKYVPPTGPAVVSEAVSVSLRPG